MTQKIIAIIQARMGSTRLPGKVMMQLSKKPILQHVLERVKRSNLISEVVIATTLLPKDDEINDFAQKFNVPIFRGNSQDVLDRFYHCAEKFSADIIVRISSDSPLIDPLIIEKCVSKFIENKNTDYLSNTINNISGTWNEDYNWFPIGVAVEVFTFSALKKAWKEASTLSDREHVTEYFWKNPNVFTLDFINNSNDYSNIRLVVDYENDFLYLKKLFEIFPNETFSSLRKLIDHIISTNYFNYSGINKKDKW